MMRMLRCPNGLLGLLILSAGCGSKNSGNGDDAASGDAAPMADANLLPDALEQSCTPVSGTDLALEPVASGLTRPVLVTSPPGDGRLFILEQSGRIRIVKDGQLLSTPFLDISDLAKDLGNEQGLLGLTFHPDFARNGRFFVNYTAVNPDNDTKISEYHVSADNPDVADPTEHLLLTFHQPFGNHNGGNMQFGPDGYLYIGQGDGGSGGDPMGNGQNPATFLGTMLRIDVDSGDPYGIPAGNPYASSANGPSDPRPEIWAIGLRNPWRWSFDRQTGDLWIGDVGQGNVEEVDVAVDNPAGLNYGWNVAEGNTCYNAATCDTTGFHAPLATYTHDGGRCSITGGFVYRGSCMPDVNGWYFYGDYCTNQVWVIDGPTGTPTDVSTNLGTGVLNGLSSFGQDALGELYVTSLSGEVYRITTQ